MAEQKIVANSIDKERIGGSIQCLTLAGKKCRHTCQLGNLRPHRFANLGLLLPTPNEDRPWGSRDSFRVPRGRSRSTRGDRSSPANALAGPGSFSCCPTNQVYHRPASAIALSLVSGWPSPLLSARNVAMRVSTSAIHSAQSRLCLVVRSVRWQSQMGFPTHAIEPSVWVAYVFRDALAGEPTDRLSLELTRPSAMPFVCAFCI